MSHTIANIFVKFDMLGKKTCNMTQIQSTTTITTFKQKIVDKEGPQVAGVRLLFRGKQLESVRQGRTMTLEDYGIQNESTIFAALRLLGGAEAANSPEGDDTIRRMNEKEVVKYGGIITKESCFLYTSAGCSKQEIAKAKIPGCNHIVCADCFYYTMTRENMEKNKTEIHCPDSGCKSIVKFDLAFAISAATQHEQKEIEAQFAKNTGLAVGIRICPNLKCQSFVFRPNKDSLVRCPACKKNDYCWWCSKVWTNGASRAHCGNPDCDPTALIITMLEDSVANHTKVISGMKNVPELRMCPNKKCCLLNIHHKDCKHMTCVCKHQYCQACLKDWKSHDNSKCTVVGVQQVTKDLVNSLRGN